MKTRAFITLMGAFLAVCLLVAPSYGKGVISAKELDEIRGDDGVRIISTRSLEDYEKVHIEGAIHVDHLALYEEGDVKGLMKSPEEIAQYLGDKGISETNTIVIYDAGKGNTSGRLYWILEYLGCKDVRILDGQMKQWRSARGKVTRKVEEYEPVEFHFTLNGKILATADDVRKDGVLLVDVRSKEEYDGKKGEASRKGHIPGAVNLCYELLLDEEGVLKSKEELAKLFEGAGITADKDVILYCDTSVRAGLVYMALDTVLEYPKVRVYDGALFEWAADPANEMAVAG